MTTKENKPYQEYYQLLFPIAKNMLRNTEDAHDLVQDTLLAWLASERSDIENPKGYLVRALINKCLNFIRNHKKRQSEVEIAPELLVDYIPSLIENSDSISLTLLLMMERLSPMERAVFLLKEVFGYSHREIAELLGISEEYSRQVLARARKHLRGNKSRFEVDPEHHKELYLQFVEVCQGNNLEELIRILKKDVKLYNGETLQAVSGNVAVASFLVNQFRSAGNSMMLRLMWQNGMPLLIMYLYHQPVYHIQLGVEAGEIDEVRIVSNILHVPNISAPVFV